MQRMSIGAVAAAVAGFLVLAVGVWAQARAIDGARTEIWIAYLTAGEARSLEIRAHPGGVVQTLPLSAGAAAVAPTWSPDGDKLFWVELKQEDEIVLHLWDRKTGADVSIEAEGFVGARLYWSPDSELILAAGDPVTVWDREGRVVFSEGPPKNLTQSGSVLVLPGGWSNDGQRIAMRRDDSLVVYDRRSGLHVYSTGDFGLPGSFTDYTPLPWDKAGNLQVVLSRREGPAPTVFALDLARRSVVTTTTGEEASELLASMYADLTRNWIPRRDTQSLHSSQGRSADGRAPFLTLFEFTTGGQVKNQGVVVRRSGSDVEIPLTDALAPLTPGAMLDVVVVGGKQ